MNVSSARPKPGMAAWLLGAGIALVATYALSVSPVHAQSGAQSGDNPGPVSLTPNTQGAQVPDAGGDGGDPRAGAESPLMEMPETEIKVSSLESVDLDTIGVLAPEDGGLGRDLWYGMERAELEFLLGKLPVTTSSPASRGMMRRLLLTGADVPDGEHGKMVSIRASLLAKMGDFVGVQQLMNALPGRVSNEGLLRIEVDTRLLTGDNARACDMAQMYMAEQGSDYWQKIFIYCQALAGEHDAAALGLSLLREMGARDDVFFSLIDQLSRGGKASGINSLPDPSPLNLALARAAKLRLPSDVIESNLPGVLRAIAISPNATPELRLEAAERAEVAGALPVDSLRQLYASISFSDEELRNPLSTAQRRSGPMSRALLYRASLMQTVTSAQAEALSRALELARSGGRYASTARAFLPVLERITPSEELAWFAPEAIRAYLITLRHNEAMPWFELLEDATRNNARMANELLSLMPVARISGFAGARDWSLDNLAKWWETTGKGDRARDSAALLGAVFDAVGESVPNEFWVPLVEGPELRSSLQPHPALWFRLEAASERAHVGETLLLSLAIMGSTGPAGVEPVVLHRILRSLRNIGLEDEAREMALEALVSAGL